jgi:hypothetical protein
MQVKAIAARLEHLLEDVTTIEEPGDPAEAERLLAEFTAISVGVTRQDRN